MHQLSKLQKKLRKSLLQHLFDANTSHIGSSLSMIDILEAIYSIKQPHEKVILSNGHAAMALYVVLEHHGLLSKKNIQDLGVHPDRNAEFNIDASTGSLGQGLPIAVGMALAERTQRVYCTISDGECAEGSIWECLRIIRQNNILNLTVILSANGWGAYDPVNLAALKSQLRGFGFHVKKIDGHNLPAVKKAIGQQPLKPTILFAKTNSEQFSFLKQQDAHYCVMTEDNYLKAMQELT